MKIALQDIIPPIASKAERFKKIILAAGTTFYPNDIPQNEYEEIILHTLGDTGIKNPKWKTLSRGASGKFSPVTNTILQHVTRSRNIFSTTADAHFILHHSTYTLNSNLEIIPITSKMRAGIMREINQYASEGNSISGIAIKRIESSSSNTRNIHNGIFIALALHEYSLLPDANKKIDAMKNSDTSIKIFSNELLPTCKYLARKIGINASNDCCITSDDMQSMDDSTLVTHLTHTTIFAQMKNIDRDRITRLLIQQGHELCD